MKSDFTIWKISSQYQLVLNFVFVPGNNLVEYCCKPKKVKLALLLFDKVNV